MPTMNQLDPTKPCGYFDTTCPVSSTKRCSINDGLPKNINDPIYQNTGVQCIDVKDALLGFNNNQKAHLIQGAGGIKHTVKTIDPCTFELPHRAHKRGGYKYDASIATIPINSLQIINMEEMSHKCTVPLQGEPKTVVYVPSAFHYNSPYALAILETPEGMALGLLIFIVIIVTIATIVIVICTYHCYKRHQHGIERMTDKDYTDDNGVGAGAGGIEMQHGGVSTRVGGPQEATIRSGSGELA